jgi:hypothetical protein
MTPLERGRTCDDKHSYPHPHPAPFNLATQPSAGRCLLDTAWLPSPAPHGPCRARTPPPHHPTARRPLPPPPPSIHPHAGPRGPRGLCRSRSGPHTRVAAQRASCTRTHAHVHSTPCNRTPLGTRASSSRELTHRSGSKIICPPPPSSSTSTVQERRERPHCQHGERLPHVECVHVAARVHVGVGVGGGGGRSRHGGRWRFQGYRRLGGSGTP